jgi:ParB family chromosome partitioning protein
MLDAVQTSATVRTIPLELIDADLGNVRRTAASAEDDAGLVASLQQQGLIQPVMLRPAGGLRFTIIAGARRVKAARALAWPDIPAIIADVSDHQATAIQAAENAHRSQMHPIDVWKAMVSLQDSGMAFALAAQCLNLSDRRARQLDRLGRIAEPLIEAMRTTGIPEEAYLFAIANASIDEQLAAFKKYEKAETFTAWVWNEMARALTVRWFSRAEAIFDIDKAPDVRWQEDVFAEPGSREAVTTTDLDAFLAHQRDALSDQVAARKKKGQSVDLGKWNASGYMPAIPSGYRPSYDKKPRSMKLPDGDPRLLILAIDPSNGRVHELLVTRVAKPAAQHQPDEPSAQAEAAPAPPRAITNAGLQMIAAAQTRAIRDRLESHGGTMRPDLLLRLLCLAVCGDNVSVRMSKYAGVHREDIAAKLLDDEGKLIEIGDIRPIAAELLARMLFANDPVTEFGSGRPGNAIAIRICAAERLPSFDSPEFLKTLSAATLREAAEACGITDAKTAAVMRARLAGNIGSKWSPEAAEFLAIPMTRSALLDDDGPEDEG